MTEPKVIISGIELTAEEFAATGIKLVTGGNYQSIFEGNYKKRFREIKKALNKLPNEKQASREQLESTTKITLTFQRLYRELKLKQEHEKETIDKIIDAINKKQSETRKQIPPIYADDMERVRELSELGLPIDTIVQRVGLSRSTVIRYRKKLGVQRRKP